VNRYTGALRADSQEAVHGPAFSFSELSSLLERGATMTLACSSNEKLSHVNPGWQ